MRTRETIREGFGARWLATLGIIGILLMTDRAYASYVTITAPDNGAKVSGTKVGISAAFAASTAWINAYVDGRYFASGPLNSFSPNSTSVANGTRTISAKAYNSGGSVLGSSAESVGVASSSSVTTYSGTYYFSTAGSDSNPCTSTHPCRSLGRATNIINGATPGQAILFQRGGTWYG